MTPTKTFLAVAAGVITLDLVVYVCTTMLGMPFGDRMNMISLTNTVLFVCALIWLALVSWR